MLNKNLIYWKYKYFIMKKINSTLEKISKFTEDVSEFVFKLEENMDFIPWQFVMIEINNWDEKPVKRAYSVVSYEKESNKLVLCIKNVDWVWTKWIFKLKKWDAVTIFWALWHFTLKNEKQTLYYFATWIWLPPIICLLRQVLAKESDKKIKLLFWLRYKNDIYYENELNDLKNKHSNFSYEICLSREKIEWFYHWYITKKILDEQVIWQNSECYYCGSVDVCKDLRTKLIELWLDQKSFYSEAF